MGTIKGTPSPCKGRPQWSDADYLRKLMAGTAFNEAGCWVQTKGFEFKFKVDNGTPGYRAFCYRGKSMPAHRASWTLHNGPIPAGMVIMHKCDNPPCCNPDHLKLGTRAENNKDAAAKGRYNYHKSHYTKCANGHDFSPDNTRITKQGFRACKTCQRIKLRRKAGWPEHLLALPPQPLGFRPFAPRYIRKPGDRHASVPSDIAKDGN